MTDRVLPPEEWARLAETSFAPILASLDPRWTQIGVVEDDAGQIVACWGAFLITHAEGAWIREDYRKSPSVTRRLWRRMKAMAATWGASSVVTGATTPEIEALLTRTRARPIDAKEYVLCL